MKKNLSYWIAIVVVVIVAFNFEVKSAHAGLCSSLCKRIVSKSIKDFQKDDKQDFMQDLWLLFFVGGGCAGFSALTEKQKDDEKKKK